MENKNKLVNMQNEMSEINEIAEQTYYLEQKVWEWNQTISKNKEKLSKKLGKKSNFVSRVDDDTKFSITKEIKANIKFYVEKLAKKLDKERYKRVVDRTVVVKNLDGLIKLLKKNGISPKDFKTFIEVIDEPNSESIDGLIETEELTIDELVGCYEVKFDEKVSVRKTK